MHNNIDFNHYLTIKKKFWLQDEMLFWYGTIIDSFYILILQKLPIMNSHVK